MNIISTATGPVFRYDTVEELTYNLLNCIGMSVKPDGTVIDTELNTVGGAIIKISGKSLKANIDSRNIHYAGDGEVLLDVIFGYKTLNDLLGVFLDKKKMFDEKETLSIFPTDSQDTEGNRITCMSVRFTDGEQFDSDYYYNRCLALIDIMFKIGEMQVDIHPFDSIDYSNKEK